MFIIARHGWSSPPPPQSGKSFKNPDSTVDLCLPPHRKALDPGLRAYERIARMAAPLVADGGYLVLCSCSHAADLTQFRAACTRGIGKADMIHNAARPHIEVNPETYEVRADGELLVCEPAQELPLAQRYFMY